MPAAVCPSCKSQITLSSNVRLGQHVRCGSCNEELEIIWLDPMELDWPFDDDLDDYSDLDDEGDD